MAQDQHPTDGRDQADTGYSSDVHRGLTAWSLRSVPASPSDGSEPDPLHAVEDQTDSSASGSSEEIQWPSTHPFSYCQGRYRPTMTYWYGLIGGAGKEDLPSGFDLEFWFRNGRARTSWEAMKKPLPPAAHEV